MSIVLWLLLAFAFLVFVGYIKFADDPFGRAKAEERRIKERSDAMLTEINKNVAERKERINNRKFAVPVPGQRNYLGRRRGGSGGWR